MKLLNRIALAGIAALSTLAAASSRAREPRSIPSNDGTWLVEFECDPAEVPLSADFAIELRIRANDAERSVVEGLELRFDARMPEHRHGMRVVPRVWALGEGRFRIEGARLHMPGAWELHFDVTRGAITERAQARIDLE